MTPRSKFKGDSNRPWNIERTDPSTTDKSKPPSLSYGQTLIPLADIVQCRLQRESNWDVAGQHFNFILYVAVSAIFLFLIVDAGWRIQFLIAIVLFLSIAAMSLGDVLTTNKIKYYRVEFHTTHGCAHSYTTASDEDAHAMLSALRDAGVRVI